MPRMPLYSLAVFSCFLFGACGEEAAKVNAADVATADTPTADVAPEAKPCTADPECAATQPCHKGVCAASGFCADTVAVNGTACDDGDGCTGADACNAGTCAGVAKSCDDSNPCTTDSCAKHACAHAPADGGPCDDNDACTGGDACAAGVCGGASICQCKSNADCQAVEDGDLCNGTLYCSDGACKVNPATVVSCSAANDGACSKNACEETSGICAPVPSADGASCDDGDACTVGDLCSAGACEAGTSTCSCSADADCLQVDDGDLCNGTLFCNGASGKCEVNPATVVVCKSVDDTACSKNTCAPKTGVCAAVALADGVTCDDANACTQGDVCSAGQCAAGVDTCACKVAADCAKYDDGDLCNGAMFCNVASGKCLVNPATVVNCPSVDDTPCSKNTCAPKLGVCAAVVLPDGVTCDADGNACTTDDACKAGACVVGTAVCACKADAECAGKDDGNLCNGVLFCDKTTGQCAVNPATVVVCQTGLDTACLQHVCAAATGQCGTKNVNEGGACDADGNLCTLNDTCLAGTCVADTNACPCQADGECGGGEDGNLCNGTLYCDKAAKVCVVNAKTLISCPSVDDTACGANLCQAKSGACAMVTAGDGKPCDDGIACTGSDACANGACKGTLLACDDKNPCTIDSCGTGKCATTPEQNGTPCDDGLQCTLADGCVAGACTGSVKTCDDFNVCTDDACNEATGCSHLANAAACNDYSGCTSGDACSGGTCVGTPKVCNDGDPCTTDGCNAYSGSCSTTPAADGGACDDGKACTSADACKSGACAGKIGDCACSFANECNDGDACTTDSCGVASKQCLHVALVCDDKKPCTADTCNAKTGQCVYTNDDTASPGVTTCAPDDCTVGTPSCKSGAVLCANAVADPAKNGLACLSGEGTCSGATCFVAKAPVFASAGFPGAIKAGAKAALSIVVVDANNVGEINDIAAVTVDLSGIGGQAGAAMTGTGADPQGQGYGIEVPTTGLAAGTYLLPVQALDKTGKTASTIAALQVYTGSVIAVGAGQTYTTLASGLAAAVSGDTILVHDGTYTGSANKNLNPAGKVLSFVSAGGAAKTVIDCEGAARAFNFSNPGGNMFVSVAGLTLKNCGASALRVATAQGDAAEIAVSASVFDSNKNGEVGGAIIASGAGTKLVVTGSSFSGNIAGDTGAYLDGGAIAMTDGVLTVSNSHFTGNTGNYGDAVSVVGTCQGNLTGCTFSGHKGANRVVSFQGTANLNVTACTFTNETKAYYCLAGDGTSGNLEVVGSRFEGCNVAIISFNSKICTVNQTVVKGSKHTTNYGAVSFCAIKDSLFAGNKGGPSFYGLKTTQTLQNTSFFDNDATYYDVVLTSAAISGGVFRGNKGATVVNITSSALDQATLRNNVTTAATAQVAGAAPTVSNCQFIGNQAVTGGALHGYYGTKGVLANLLLVGNSATTHGGGLYFTGGSWTVSNVTAVGNTAELGGGVYLEAATAAFKSSIFWDNKALLNKTKPQGAQIYIKSMVTSVPTFSFCDVRNDDLAPGGDIVDDGLKINAGDTFVAGVLGNLSSSPEFVATAKGEYFLAQTAAGQAKQSPCVDPPAAGVTPAPLASAVGLDKRTTRTDGVTDSGALDHGYHYTP